MARPGITYLDVAKAATQLVEQGQRPSIEAIRQLLGTGSNSTINQHLRQWKNHHGNQIELEQGLPEPLLIAVRGIYEASCADANQQLEKSTQAHQQAINELRHHMESLEKINHQLLQEKFKLEQLADQTAEEKSALTRLNDQLNKTLNEKMAENGLLNEKLTDRQAEIKRVTAQISHFQTSLDHYRETIREERSAEKRVFETEIAALKHHVTQQDKAIRQFEASIQALNQQVAFLQAEKNEAEDKLEKSLEKSHQLEMNTQKINLQHSHLQAQYDEIESECQALQETSKNDQEKMVTLQIEMKKHQEQLLMCQSALEKAEDKLANLSDKHLFLTQEKAELAGQLNQILAAK